MIKPNHSRLHGWLINSYINYILNADFREIRITGDFKPDERPILLIPNHFSWWDGFFAWYLNQKLLKKRYHVMMLEHELSKRMFFARVGAFSINLNSRSIFESLDYCIEILNNPKNMLLMFPQGKLESQHKHDIIFRKGVEWIIQKSTQARIVLSACLVDYHSHCKPSLTIALKEYDGHATLDDLQSAFNEHLHESIVNQDKIFS
jgi:1-acyl-sn-glycerol-3-phosphate acyltransferase